MESIHFCGGLPRSGSTVFANILAQNPRIFSTNTCALPDIIGNSLLIHSRSHASLIAMSVEQADKAMYGLIHGGTKGWFEGLTQKPIIISKNRRWSRLFHLYPNSKYICIIRDLRDIVQSFETVNDSLLALHTMSQNDHNLKSMIEQEKYDHHFVQSNSLNEGLDELIHLIDVYEKNPSKVLFIRYEDFTKKPLEILNQVYLHINEEFFNHDLENIQQSFMVEHDNVYTNERTSHQVNSTFQYYKQPVRKLSDKFNRLVVQNHRWFYERFYPEELHR